MISNIHVHHPRGKGATDGNKTRQRLLLLRHLVFPASFGSIFVNFVSSFFFFLFPHINVVPLNAAGRPIAQACAVLALPPGRMRSALTRVMDLEERVGGLIPSRLICRCMLWRPKGRPALECTAQG